MNIDFDFDKIIDRRKVPTLKTHPMVLGKDSADLFAAGVADMDFHVAPPIIEAVKKRAEHQVFGYEAFPDQLMPALADWQYFRHGWRIEEDQIVRAPNVLNSLALAVSAFSEPGDGIIVQTPVFFDFFDIIKENHRTLICNPLMLKNRRYEMDFAGLEQLAAEPRNRILFLCNPHNPIGRVWGKKDLARLGQICLRHNVLVVSDELHGDITFKGHQFIPFASQSPEFADHSVTLLSPAKSFNIAGCCSSFAVIPNKELRKQFQAESSRLTVNKNNAFANVAMVAAYRGGAPWLKAVTHYISSNLGILRQRLGAMPNISIIEPDGTFLVWVDFRELGLTPEGLREFLREQAGWAITNGISFGSEGAGFARLNLACPRQKLTAALDRLEDAVMNI